MDAKKRIKSARIFVVVSLVLLALITLLAGCSGGNTDSTENQTQEEPKKSQRVGGSSSDDASQADYSLKEDADCGACHTFEGDSAEQDGTLAFIHKDQHGCVNCHEYSDALIEAHKKASPEAKSPKFLKKTEVTEDECIACHGTREELALITASSTTLTDLNGLTVNPHELPQVEDHQDIMCWDCHSAHEVKDAKQVCLGCHHADVFECGTCHGG